MMKPLRSLLDIYNPDSERPDYMRELLLRAESSEIKQLLIDEQSALADHPEERRARIALDILAPIAARLNMQAYKREIENEAFRILHPNQYQLTKRLLASKEADNRKALLKFIHALSAHLEAAGVEVDDISGRTKQPYSLYKKLKKTGDISDVHDLLAVRILAKDESQCYEVLDVAHTHFTPVLERFKDYIKRPKPNGYQSLHATIETGKHTVEIQIRTRDMHEHAEGGTAAHWHYDQHKQTKHYLRGRSIRKIVTTAKRYVYVFSPQGDPYRLEDGATALDFAFAVHTGVGLRTKSLRVNDSIAPLDRRLEDGDQIEVITQKEARPRRDWLRIVTSRRAKNRIRTWLREVDRDRYKSTGRDMLIAEFGGRLPDGLEDIAHQYGLAELDDLFVSVGARYINPKTIRQRLIGEAKSATVSAYTQTTNQSTHQVIVGGMEGLQYRLAHCCEPRPPQKIAGYITRGLGITVHRQQCPEITHDRSRLVDCHWA